MNKSLLDIFCAKFTPFTFYNLEKHHQTLLYNTANRILEIIKDDNKESLNNVKEKCKKVISFWNSIYAIPKKPDLLNLDRTFNDTKFLTKNLFQSILLEFLNYSQDDNFINKLRKDIKYIATLYISDTIFISGSFPSINYSFILDISTKTTYIFNDDEKNVEIYYVNIKKSPIKFHRNLFDTLYHNEGKNALTFIKLLLDDQFQYDKYENGIVYYKNKPIFTPIIEPIYVDQEQHSNLISYSIYKNTPLSLEISNIVTDYLDYSYVKMKEYYNYKISKYTTRYPDIKHTLLTYRDYKHPLYYVGNRSITINYKNSIFTTNIYGRDYLDEKSIQHISIYKYDLSEKGVLTYNWITIEKSFTIYNNYIFDSDDYLLIKLRDNNGYIFLHENVIQLPIFDTIIKIDKDLNYIETSKYRYYLNKEFETDEEVVKLLNNYKFYKCIACSVKCNICIDLKTNKMYNYKYKILDEIG